jgi:hypothetical protein
MIVVKLNWDIIEEDDKVLVILPEETEFTHPDIVATFRESIHKIKCEFVVAMISNFNEDDILKYEELYDIEFQLLKNVALLKNNRFLKHHNKSVVYILQGDTKITPFFTKVVINTLNCDKLTFLKELKIPMHYGMCVFNEIITMNVFMKGSISLVIGETRRPFVNEEPVDLIFNCSGFFIKDSVSYEESIICIDVIHDLIYRLEKLDTIVLFIGKFTFDNADIEKRWNTFFTKQKCIYDTDAYETLKPKTNSRFSKDVPNLLKMYYSKKSDLLGINRL